VKKPCHIVFTTIHHPKVLENLHDNIQRYGHLEEVKVWVVGDRKTPPTAASLASEISARGLETVFFSVDEQDEWGKQFSLYNLIPCNTDGRRVFGYLRALEDGCDVLISMDDDNVPSEDDFVARHRMTGQEWRQPLLKEEKRFHNVCEYLTFEPSRLVFPRGFPFRLRGHANQPEWVASPEGTVIGVTEGLWLQEPDVDATTWLNGKIRGVSYHGPDVFVLDHSTWSPVNTQNTSIVRELIPAFVFVTMGWPVPGGKIDRYGDIWGGYFLLALIQGTKYHVAFGRPLVEHRRNPHDYVDDLRCEFWGMVLTDWLLEILRSSFKPACSHVTERVLELTEFLDGKAAPQLPSWCPAEFEAFLHSTSTSLRAWSAACIQIGV
jgi:hypothetical protein